MANKPDLLVKLRSLEYSMDRSETAQDYCSCTQQYSHKRSYIERGNFCSKYKMAQGTRYVPVQQFTVFHK